MPPLRRCPTHRRRHRRLIFRVGFHPDLTPSLRLQNVEMTPQHGNLLRLAHAALDGVNEALGPDAFVDITLAPLPATMDSGGAAVP